MTATQIRERVHHRPFNSLWWLILLSWLIVASVVYR